MKPIYLKDPVQLPPKRVYLNGTPSKRLAGVLQDLTLRTVISMVLGFVLGFLCCVTVSYAETMYVTASQLNVRAEPSLKADVEFRFDRGDGLEVVAIEGEWAQITIAGDTLYAALEYLSDVPPMTESKAYEVTGNGRVRVRNKPGGAKVVRWLQPGDVVEVIGWRQGFAAVSDGFVDGQYLKEE